MSKTGALYMDELSKAHEAIDELVEALEAYVNANGAAEIRRASQLACKILNKVKS